MLDRFFRFVGETADALHTSVKHPPSNHPPARSAAACEGLKKMIPVPQLSCVTYPVGMSNIKHLWFQSRNSPLSWVFDWWGNWGQKMAAAKALWEVSPVTHHHVVSKPSAPHSPTSDLLHQPFPPFGRMRTRSSPCNGAMLLFLAVLLILPGVQRRTTYFLPRRSFRLAVSRRRKFSVPVFTSLAVLARLSSLTM